MNTNEQTIHHFYSAFQQRDYAGMNACYDAEVVFSDMVFGLLNSQETRAMWEMLCKNAKDLTIRFDNIQLLDEEYATCDWEATYTFTQTGRKVVNKVKAHMRLKDGLITEHSDAFDIYKWSRQAFGLRGWLFGWTNFMRNRIHINAKKRLLGFMEQQ